MSTILLSDFLDFLSDYSSSQFPNFDALFDSCRIDSGDAVDDPSCMICLGVADQFPLFESCTIDCTDADDDPSCPICPDSEGEDRSPQYLRTPCCKRSYHATCMRHWLEDTGHGFCPLCRRDSRLIPDQPVIGWLRARHPNLEQLNLSSLLLQEQQLRQEEREAAEQARLQRLRETEQQWLQEIQVPTLSATYIAMAICASPWILAWTLVKWTWQCGSSLRHQFPTLMTEALAIAVVECLTWQLTFLVMTVVVSGHLFCFWIWVLIIAAHFFVPLFYAVLLACQATGLVLELTVHAIRVGAGRFVRSLSTMHMAAVAILRALATAIRIASIVFLALSEIIQAWRRPGEAVKTVMKVLESGFRDGWQFAEWSDDSDAWIEKD
jgi:hypothetical protein